jgi:hypothetical protein
MLKLIGKCIRMFLHINVIYVNVGIYFILLSLDSVEKMIWHDIAVITMVFSNYRYCFCYK